MLPSALRELARVLAPGRRLLILHDLGQKQVNAVHSGAGAPIQHDPLPPGAETRRMLLRAGFSDVWVEDTPVHYLAGGQRSA
jgi:hypothetical protein